MTFKAVLTSNLSGMISQYFSPKSCLQCQVVALYKHLTIRELKKAPQNTVNSGNGNLLTMDSTCIASVFCKCYCHHQGDRFRRQLREKKRKKERKEKRGEKSSAHCEFRFVSPSTAEARDLSQLSFDCCGLKNVLIARFKVIFVS